jgi:hypothetical protein
MCLQNYFGFLNARAGKINRLLAQSHVDYRFRADSQVIPSAEP